MWGTTVLGSAVGREGGKGGWGGENVKDEREEDETDGVSTLNGAECVKAQLV